MQTLELLGVDALRDTVSTFRDIVRRTLSEDQPAQRLPGARRRHRHEHGAHPRRGRGRDGQRPGRPRCNLRRDQLRGVDRGAWQQWGHRLADPARHRLDIEVGRRGDRPRRRNCTGGGDNGAYAAVLTPVEGTILTVVRESAEAARDAADAGGSLAEVIRAAGSLGAPRSNTPSCFPYSRTPESSMPAAPDSCCSWTPPCTSSTAIRSLRPGPKTPAPSSATHSTLSPTDRRGSTGRWTSVSSATR